MLYYLFNFLEYKYQIPGAGLFQYISFRAAFALIFSLIISIFFGKKIIKILILNNIGEKVRILGLKDETKKKWYTYYGWNYYNNRYNLTGTFIFQIQ